MRKDEDSLDVMFTFTECRTQIPFSVTTLQLLHSISTISTLPSPDVVIQRSDHEEKQHFNVRLLATVLYFHYYHSLRFHDVIPDFIRC